jgi:hypothetical protein
VAAGLRDTASSLRSRAEHATLAASLSRLPSDHLRGDDPKDFGKDFNRDIEIQRRIETT